MYVEVITTNQDLVNEIRQQLDKQYKDLYHGILITSIVPTPITKMTVNSSIVEQLKTSKDIKYLMPSSVQVEVLFKNLKSQQLTINQLTVHLRVAIKEDLQVTDYPNLYRMIDKCFIYYLSDLRLQIPRIVDGNILPIGIEDTEKVFFLTLSNLLYNEIVEGLNSKNYVKPVTNSDIETILKYYVTRDTSKIEPFRQLMIGVERQLNQQEWYLHRNYPIYRKQLFNGDTVYISNTFCILDSGGQIYLLYDYRRKEILPIVERNLTDFGIKTKDIQIILDLYRYNHRG